MLKKLLFVNKIPNVMNENVIYMINKDKKDNLIESKIFCTDGFLYKGYEQKDVLTIDNLDIGEFILTIDKILKENNAILDYKVNSSYNS